MLKSLEKLPSDCHGNLTVAAFRLTPVRDCQKIASESVRWQLIMAGEKTKFFVITSHVELILDF